MAARAWKSPWLVTVLDAYGGRLAIEATIEPPATMSRNHGGENPGRAPTDMVAGFYREEGWGREGYPIYV